MNFFNSIEVETRTTFRLIHHSQRDRSVLTQQNRIGTQHVNFDFDIAEKTKWKNLQDQFVWCVLCEWPHIDNEDIKTFSELRELRNDIAHGKVLDPSESDVERVKWLAAKLLSG
jgi:hypothetical protein